VTLTIHSTIILAGKKCIRDLRDSSFCTFSGLKEPNEIYDLSSLTDDFPYQIKRVKFEDTFMFHIQKEITLAYSNLEDLDVSNCYVWRVYNIDFTQYNHLKKLNASNNVIGLLRSLFNVNFNELENLDLSYNRIKKIEDDAFYQQSALKYLNLSHNQIEELPSDFFLSVKTVKILNLSHNRISIINNERHFFSTDSAFEEIYLNDNQIVSLSQQILPTLNTLDVSNNLLRGVFDVSDCKLKHLNIHGNSLTKLSINDNLEQLDASDSKERAFEIDFGENYALKELKLSNLDVPDFNKLFQYIGKLDQIENLDMSHNNLETFDFGNKQLPKSLNLLNLERANLRTVENLKDLKVVLPNLQEINILDNLLSCKDLQIVIDDFLNSNINVTGLDAEHMIEFIESNCVDSAAHHSSESNNKALWTFFIISLAVNVITAILFIYFKFISKGSEFPNIMLSNLL